MISKQDKDKRIQATVLNTWSLIRKHAIANTLTVSQSCDDRTSSHNALYYVEQVVYKDEILNMYTYQPITKDTSYLESVLVYNEQLPYIQQKLNVLKAAFKQRTDSAWRFVTLTNSCGPMTLVNFLTTNNQEPQMLNLGGGIIFYLLRKTPAFPCFDSNEHTTPKLNQVEYNQFCHFLQQLSSLTYLYQPIEPRTLFEKQIVADDATLKTKVLNQIMEQFENYKAFVNAKYKSWHDNLVPDKLDYFIANQELDNPDYIETNVDNQLIQRCISINYLSLPELVSVPDEKTMKRLQDIDPELSRFQDLDQTEFARVSVESPLVKSDQFDLLNTYLNLIDR